MLIEWLNNIRKSIKKEIKIKRYEKKGIYLDKTSKVREVEFGGKNIIRANAQVERSILGYGSYISENCKIFKTKIGKFCSIASGVEVIMSNHPVYYVTTFPFAYSKYDIIGNFKKAIPYKEENKYATENYYVKIGNDVWIGAGVKILHGVKIGNGAIIGMGAVVLKDVPAYSVVVGVPAKVIKYRFSEEEIKKLEKFEWWNKEIKWIEENIDKFSDIKSFIKFIEKYNNKGD